MAAPDILGILGEVVYKISLPQIRQRVFQREPAHHDRGERQDTQQEDTDQGEQPPGFPGEQIPDDDSESQAGEQTAEGVFRPKGCRCAKPQDEALAAGQQSFFAHRLQHDEQSQRQHRQEKLFRAGTVGECRRDGNQHPQQRG